MNIQIEYRAEKYIKHEHHDHREEKDIHFNEYFEAQKDHYLDCDNSGDQQKVALILATEFGRQFFSK